MVNKMQFVLVRFFDGKSSQAFGAVLSHQPPFLQVDWQNQTRQYRTTQMQYLPPMQGVAAALLFDDGAKVEFLDTPPDWLPTKERKIFANIAKFEQSWRWALASVLASIVVVGGIFRFGLPMAADYVADKIPNEILQEASNEAEEKVLQQTKPSTLSKDRQAEILALYQRLNATPTAKIVFRSGEEEWDENALALPNNTIILTDGLIEIAKHDYEILAVLAHEQGHIFHKHSLRQVVRTLGISTLLTVLVGDVSSLIVTVPVVLTSLQYSQEFEMQADQYAIDSLRKIGVSPMYLSDILHHLHRHQEPENGFWAIFSTHPNVEKRTKHVIKDVREHKENQQTNH